MGPFAQLPVRRPFTCVLVAVVAVVVCVAVPASAQILNIEKKLLERREGAYLVGNLGLRFNYNNRSPTLRQPAKAMNTGLSSNTAYFVDEHGLMLINDYQVHLINDSEIVNAGLSHLRAQFHRHDVLSYEVFTQYQYDRPRGLATRLLLGAGPRFGLVRSTLVNVTVGTAAMYELENWDHPETNARVEARFIKSSTYVNARFEVNERVGLNGVIYFQTGYDGTHGRFRHRVSSDINLTVGIVEHLALTSSFSASYETQPVVPIIPFIFSTMNGLQIDF